MTDAEAIYAEIIKRNGKAKADMLIAELYERMRGQKQDKPKAHKYILSFLRGHCEHN